MQGNVWAAGGRLVVSSSKRLATLHSSTGPFEPALMCLLPHQVNFTAALDCARLGRLFVVKPCVVSDRRDCGGKSGARI